MSLKSTINRLGFAAYAKLKYPESRWRWFNRAAVSTFESNRPQLSAVQERVVAGLREDGIASVPLSELTGDQNLLAALQTDAQMRKAGGFANHKKTYLINYWEENVELDLSNPFLELALSPVMIDIANTYMGMYTDLLYYHLQETVPTEERTHSRNWHRDPQEWAIVKVFLYLNDVDENAGPFVYVPKSAPGYQPYGNHFPQEVPAGSYPGNEEVEAAISSEDIKPQTGPAGTVVFCNTNGLHYGGAAKSKNRLMFTMGYAAPTYKDTQAYYYDQSFLDEAANLPPQSKFAIRKQWMKKS